MAGGAFVGSGRMLTVQPEASLGRVFERACVQVPQLCVDARVLDMTRDAFLRVSMDANRSRDAIFDRLVTGQATRRRHLPAGFVA
jgi:hypothetical protein